jgi:protease-4
MLTFRSALALSILAWCCNNAGAQTRATHPLGGEPPTAGVRLSAPSLVSGSDASTVEVSPGALGLVPSWSFFYHHAELRDGGRVGGTGDAFLIALPVPLVRSLVLGAGLQWLRPPEAIGYVDSVKLSLALGWQLSPRFALGLAYHAFVSDGDPELGGLGTLDFGFVVRPAQWVAGGFVIRDLTTPVYAGMPVQRVYDFELAVRPLLSRRIEVGAALRIGERRGDLDPRFRLAVEPLRGLQLFGDVELVTRDFLRDGGSLTDVRAGVGLAFNLERVGVSMATTLGRTMPAGGPLRSADARSAFQGATFSMAFSGARREPLIELDRRVIELALEGELDQRQMIQLATVLQEVARRHDVAGLLLRLEPTDLGWAQVQELRSLVQRVRRAGKRTYAYLRGADARAYYLASAAEHVFVDPDGGIDLAGLAAHGIYLRGLLDHAGINPEFVRIAEYKSAPETFTEKKPSAAAAEVREAILDAIFGQLVGDLAADRRKTREQMRRIIDEGPYTPTRALAAGLVDRLIAPHQLKPSVQMHARAGLAHPTVLGREPDRWPVGPAIAVIPIEGDIVQGKSRELLFGRRISGDETVAAALQWAAANSRVRAIVLRVNSPGGSALASARMWRAVREARKLKPVIVSFADVAASGGYYAACGADAIFAQPATITGSIGIFSGKFDFSGLLRKLGVTSEASTRGKRALLRAFDRPYSADERAFELSRLRYHYQRFLEAVATGRKLSAASVDRVARGRTWTGSQALTQRLIDRRGGLIEALEEAKRRAGLAPQERVPVFVVPLPSTNLVQRVVKMLGDSQATATPELPRAARELLHAVPPALLEARDHEPLARMRYDLAL